MIESFYFTGLIWIIIYIIENHWQLKRIIRIYIKKYKNTQKYYNYNRTNKKNLMIILTKINKTNKAKSKISLPRVF